MSLTLKVPSIGESIQEATVGVWKKAEGDWVGLDEPLVEIESEKATLEIPSPGAGVLRKILRHQGDTVAIGEALADIDEGAKPEGVARSDRKGDLKTAVNTKTETKAETGSGGKPTPAKTDNGKADGKADGKNDGKADGKTDGKAAQGGAVSQVSAPDAATMPSAPSDGERAASPTGVRAAPSARKAMSEGGLTAEDVHGTGRGGRIQPLDVVRALEVRDTNQRPDPVTPPSVGLPAAAADSTRERLVPMTPLRRTIARRLVEAQQTAAILTTFNECDMTEVLAIRERYQDRFTKQHGIKLGFMGFFVKAAIEALKAFPSVNAEVRGNGVLYKDHYDIGVAVGGGKGLVVPVIRDADRSSFADIEKAIAALAARAKDNKLQLAELEGGTFTISNGGIYGSMMSTPILNPPQSGILGLHAIQKRVVVVQDQMVIRPMMYLALSYDHRIVDGREAVQFLVRVKECVETPERMLLEI